MLATVPTTVALTFSEPVVVAAGGIRVFGPDGAQLDTDDAVHLGRAATMGVGLRNVQQLGTHTVSWRVLSADSHPVAGAFTFSVGQASMNRTLETAQSRGSTTVDVVYGIARTAAFAIGCVARSRARCTRARRHRVAGQRRAGRTVTVASPTPAHHVISYDTGGPGGQGRFTVDVDPATTGPHTISVTVEDPAGNPRDVAELTATWTLAAQQLGLLPIPLQRTAPGRYIAREVQIPRKGIWQLAMTVRTSGIDRTTVTTSIDIAGR